MPTLYPRTVCGDFHYFNEIGRVSCSCSWLCRERSQVIAVNVHLPLHSFQLSEPEFRDMPPPLINYHPRTNEYH